ncbi:MAG: hypothetical protein BAJALOKI3v1_50112 [Promethearchaeota archaeon]|nr:MAG: hypothetical protein BAJALOKI3v1_50112 [Candidatus Lokiarchaeota archaeon]
MKSVLNDFTIYLAGPIEYTKDSGVAWRKKIKQYCSDFKLGIDFLDPTDKPVFARHINDEKQKSNDLKNEGNWYELRSLMKEIVRTDLRMVDRSDAVIAYINVDIYMCGTMHEIVNASVQHKPIFLIVDGGKKRCPSWLFGLIDYQEMFDSVEECISYLHKIDTGLVKIDNRFPFIKREKLCQYS